MEQEWFLGSDKMGIKIKIEQDGVVKEVEKARCIGFNNHDCEAIYKCPYCENILYGWGIKTRKINLCNKCGGEYTVV